MAQQELKVRLSADASRFKRGMTSARGSFLNFKTAAVAGTAAVAAGLVKATQAAVKFETQTAELAKLVGDRAAQPLAESISNLASELPVARDRLFEVAEAAARLGVRGRDNIKQFTRVMAEIGVATDVAADQAATSMARIAKVTGTPIRQTRNLASAINEASNTMAVSFSEVLDASQRAAPGLAALGAKSSEIVALSASVAELSANASRSGTRLNRMASTLLKVDREPAFAQALGVTVERFRQMRDNNPAQLIVDLAKRMRDSKSAAQIMNSELDETSLRILRTLAQNADQADQKLKDLNTAFRDGTSIGEEYNRFVGTAAARSQIAQNRFAELATTIGTHLLPAFVATLEKANFLLDALNNLIGASNEASQTFDLTAIETQLGDAVRNTSLLADQANTILSNVRSMTQELGEGQRPAFLQLVSEQIRKIRLGSADAAEAARSIVGAYETLLEQSEKAAASTESMSSSAASAAGHYADAADAASDLESELANLPGLGVSGDAGALGDALSVADEMGVLEEYVEMWKEAQSTALNFTETVEEGASVHELIVGQMASANDEAEDFERGLNRAVDGALQLMQAFGDVDSSVGQALGGVLQLGSAIEGIVNELSSAETSFAGIAGGIGAGLGALGSIIGEITRPTAAQRAAADLQVSVELLGMNTEKLAQVVDRLGTELTKQFLGLAEAFEGLDLEASIFDAGNIGDALGKFQRELDRLGLNLHDVQSLAQQFGISVDELIKILLTGEGDIAVAGQQLEAFIAMIEELRGVESEATTEAERLAEAMREMSRAFSDARASSQLMMDVFDIEGLSQRMEILFSDLASVMDGALPEIFQQLRMADLSTRSGIEQAKELLQSIFQQGAGAFGLPQDVFREFVSSMDSLLDQALRDLESAAGGGTRTGGGSSGTISVGGSGTSRPDFSQRSVITEVQAEERNVLLRGQLIQEEMQTELQRAMIQVLADLPSNIRDGVDIALGEDQLVGAS